MFKFSIIIAVYNVEEYLEETVDSIISQTLDFKENVQLILVDDGSSDNSLEIAKKYHMEFPENIIVLSKENGGQASARNLGLQYAQGKYVNFLDSDDYLSDNVLQEVYDFFENNKSEIDIVAIPMQLFERVTGPHRLNYKFNETRVIDLIKEPNNPLLSSSSSFIKYDAIKSYEFDTDLVNLEDALIINKILLDKKKYGVVNNCNYYYRQRNMGNSTVDSANTKKEYFTDRLNKFYKNIINYSISLEGEIPKFIQYLMAYDLQWLLKIPNLNVFDNDDEINEFWECLDYVLSFINVDVVYGNNNILNDVKPFFLFLLGEEKNIYINDNKELLIDVGTHNVDVLDRHRVWLDILEIKNDCLNISGILLTNFDSKNISIKVIKENSSKCQEYFSTNVKYNTDERNNRCFLGFNWKFVYNFDVFIHLDYDEISNLNFIIEYNDGIISHSFESLVGLNHSVALSDFSACITKNKYIILYKNLKLQMLPYSYFSMLRYEVSNIKKTIIDRPNFFIRSILIRLLYYILYPIMKNKKIWIFSDRSDFADDNAKHLFCYASKRNDSIKKYFAVNSDSPSFELMNQFEGNIIPFGGFQHKLLYLFADKIISSYINEKFLNPFFYDNYQLYKGLCTSERFFLQHGVTKDDISKFIKKYNNNVSLIVTVSDFERESFLNEGYGFSTNIVQTLGFPRYDNLHEINHNKQILFMPTWRLDLTNENDFLNSEYYETINNLLNNNVLFKLLKEKGYVFVFKPHAELIPYIDLLNISDDVYLSLNDSYQKLFNESSILITDFSSVFFDFAYLKKPIIYYQPNNDYHYDEGYFDYNNMGFGDVIHDENNLIDKLNYYLDNGCHMEEFYKNNVDAFFKFNDSNNCQRVYNWLLKH